MSIHLKDNLIFVQPGRQAVSSLKQSPLNSFFNQFPLFSSSFILVLNFLNWQLFSLKKSFSKYLNQMRYEWEMMMLKVWKLTQKSSFLFRVETFFHFLRISASCISRLVSSLFWHFQVSKLELVHSLYIGDVLETYINSLTRGSKTSLNYGKRPLLAQAKNKCWLREGSFLVLCRRL